MTVEKKPRRRASIVERGKDKYLVRIYRGVDPNTGKRLYDSKMILGKRSAAEKYATQELGKLDTGTYVPHSGLIVKDHLTDWLENVKRNSIEPETFDSYEFQLTRYIYPGIGKEKVSTLGFERIQRHYAKLVKEGYSPRTVEYAHSILQQGLDYAVRLRLIPTNPCRFVTLPKRTNNEKQSFTEDQAKAFLNAARECQHFTLFLLALATGVRPGELAGLRWSDVEKARIFIRQAVVWPRKKGGAWRFKNPKTVKSSRPIPIGGGLVTLLAEHRHRQMEIRLRTGAEWQNHDLVFCTAIGTPFDTRNLLRRHFRKILERAGLDASFNLYSLRHSFATLSLAGGAHHKVVSERLGHSSSKMAIDVYSHVIPTMDDGAAEKLENLLFGDLAHHSHTKTGTDTD